MTEHQELKQMIKNGEICRDTILTMIDYYEKESKILEDYITRALKRIAKYPAEIDRVFWTEYLNVFFVEDFEKKEKQIRFYKSLIAPFSLRKENLTPEMVEEARRVPIQEVLSLETKKCGGGRLKAKCPAHSERTASFIIYPDGGAHCFGCGVNYSGALDYLIKFEKVDFKQAVKQLVR